MSNKHRGNNPQPKADQDQQHPSLHPHSNPPAHRGEVSQPVPDRSGGPTKTVPPPPGSENDDPQKPGLHPQSDSKAPLAISTEHKGEIATATPNRTTGGEGMAMNDPLRAGQPAQIADQVYRPLDLAPANHPHIAVDEQRTGETPRTPANNAVGRPAVSAQRAPVAPGATVRVRLVWPADRGAKQDCRASTGVIWSGNGDVQNFPADKWHLLAPHPDVWELVDDKDQEVAHQAQVDRVESPEARLTRLNNKHRIEQNERAAAASTRDAKDLARQINTDAVVVGPSMGRPATEHAPTIPRPETNNNQLAPSTYDKAALSPHTQTDALEDKARDEGAASSQATPKRPLDEFDPQPTETDSETGVVTGKNDKADKARVEALEKEKADLAEKVEREQQPPARTFQRISEARLETLTDEQVHAEGAKRSYALHPRLTPANLRARFMELQDEAAAAAKS